MNETTKRILTSLTCILMGAVLGVMGTWFLVVKSRTAENETLQPGQDKYAEIMELVDQYYIGDDVDMTTVNDNMAAGVIAGLGDRWSYYVSAENYQNYQDNINNAYVGVGIVISAKYDTDGETLLGYHVNEVIEGGPAEEAGVLAGDILIRVEDVDVTKITHEEMKNQVQGEAGTTVNLTFLREEQEITLNVERRAVFLIPAKGEMLDGNIAYITISNFDAGCAETVIALIEEFKDQGAQAILFDIRDNPGGLKRELTALLDYLLPEGIVFHSVNYAGEEDVVMSDKNCVELPMAVLVNASSVSAAEYFACALQEYGVAIVVGEQTLGKGYYQVGMKLSDGSCVNLSIGKYYTPEGKSLIDLGVTPDYEVPLDETQTAAWNEKTLTQEEDPQLQTAIENILP